MNCDWIAACYRYMEYLVFGRALQRRRQEYISQLRDARNILILGDGDGRFTEEFLRSSTAVRIDAVDCSRRMLHLAKTRAEKYESATQRLRFYQGDARTIQLPPGKYDLIVTHFFLDCFTPDDLSSLIARLSQRAQSQAYWLISEFRVPDRGFRRLTGALLIKIMYLFFKVLTGLEASHLPDYAVVLTAHGFRRLQYKSAWGGLLISELWERH